MNPTSHPEVMPVRAVETPLPVVHKAPAPNRNDDRFRSVRRKPGFDFFALIAAFFGWIWRWVIGAAFCTTYLGAVFVVGWTYRWMQALVLKSWWKKSKFAKEGSFQDYCKQLGMNDPMNRPRWFWRERIGQVLNPDRKPSVTVQAWRKFTIPWHSLWLNFKMGVAGLFCTYLLTGWGSLLMYLGWVYGWQGSFYKVYEEYAGGGLSFGMGISLIGYVMFILGMFYVVMAQVHHAVTCERKGFFDFRFVWALIKARPTAYLGLVLLMSFFSIPIAVMKVMVANGGFWPNNPEWTNGGALMGILGYTFLCCLFWVFPAWLVSRYLAARIYSSAVLKVLRQGQISRTELHPKLAKWMDDLEIMPIPKLSGAGLERVVFGGTKLIYRWAIYVILFVFIFIWMFGANYTSEFLVYHPMTGFMNFELVQIPAFGIIPYHMLADGLQNWHGVPVQ